MLSPANTLGLLEELQVGPSSLLGRMSLVKLGVPLLRSGLCFHGTWIMFKNERVGEDLLMWEDGVGVCG